MFAILSLAAVTTSWDGPIVLSRTPLSNPAQRWEENGYEFKLTYGVLPQRFHSVSRVDRAVGDGVRLIRHGNAQGNVEKRLIRDTKGEFIQVDRVERKVAKKWVDVGRLAEVYCGNHWSMSAELTGGSASVWLNYFLWDGTSVDFGLDATGGLLVRLHIRSENE